MVCNSLKCYIYTCDTIWNLYLLLVFVERKFHPICYYKMARCQGLKFQVCLIQNVHTQGLRDEDTMPPFWPRLSPSIHCLLRELDFKRHLFPRCLVSECSLSSDWKTHLSEMKLQREKPWSSTEGYVEVGRMCSEATAAAQSAIKMKRYGRERQGGLFGSCLEMDSVIRAKSVPSPPICSNSWCARAKVNI